MHKDNFSNCKRGHTSQVQSAYRRPPHAEAARLVSALGFGFMTSAVRASERTETLVRDMLDSSYSILNDDSLSDGERSENFQAFLDTVTVFDRTALFTFVRYANTIERSDIAVFVDGFGASPASRVQQRLEASRDFTLSLRGMTVICLNCLTS